MRIFLTTIILTMLAQPVFATSAGSLIKVCTQWKDIGFSLSMSVDANGMRSANCAGYFQAMSDLGEQNCNWSQYSMPQARWKASSEQLAQFFLNKAAENPDQWTFSGYGFLVQMGASNSFPCKE
jgi:hypothetical protein